MTDETTPTGKALWTRHPGCGWRVFNDPIDITHHERLCPQLLMRKIKNLETALEKLTKVEPAAPVELPDLDSVAPWSGAEGDELVEEGPPDLAATDEYGRPVYVPAPVGPEVDQEWDDEDEEDLEPVRPIA